MVGCTDCCTAVAVAVFCHLARNSPFSALCGGIFVFRISPPAPRSWMHSPRQKEAFETCWKLDMIKKKTQRRTTAAVNQGSYYYCTAAVSCITRRV